MQIYSQLRMSLLLQVPPRRQQDVCTEVQVTLRSYVQCTNYSGTAYLLIAIHL